MWWVCSLVKVDSRNLDKTQESTYYLGQPLDLLWICFGLPTTHTFKPSKLQASRLALNGRTASALTQNYLIQMMNLWPVGSVTFNPPRSTPRRSSLMLNNTHHRIHINLESR